MKRHEVRQRALQALYQMDVGRAEASDAIAHVIEDEFNPTSGDLAYLRTLVEGTQAHQVRIDELLSSHVEGWQLDRIARVDLSILRLAMYELLEEPDVDAATVVDEAVELAKAFSTEPSGKFINGVLAKLLPVVGRGATSS